MTWEEICEDPVVAELPYRVESDEWGHILMSPPAGYIHFQDRTEILTLLARLLPDGVAGSEFPLQTSKGVKSIDAVWSSRGRLARQPPDRDVAAIAPEICVEVLSRSNTRAEIGEKMQLYFESEALECWTCDRQGGMTFYDPAGEIPRSAVCPEFPPQVTPPERRAR